MAAPILPRQYPSLDNLALPKPLVAAVRQAYQRLYDLRDFVLGWNVDNETPGGVVDGTNTQFTLLGPPAPADSLLLFKNGVLQQFGVDYTLAGNAITFTAAPALASWLKSFYRRSRASVEG